MDESPSSFSAEPIEVRYDFNSVSDTKLVKKIVRLTETSLLDVFNLALLDLLDDGSESDLSVTDNNDLRTVLATVMRIIDNFLTKFPQKIVTVRGSDRRRTRLYRIVIGRELNAIRQRFMVFGEFQDGQLEPFKPNADYVRFLISLKR
ncbi:DUF6934 family protein [Spirosoma arcticum]